MTEEARKDDRVKDTRRIINGVSIPDATGAMRTYSEESDFDDLEEAMTPAQLARLKEQGALDGNWHAKGKPGAPMVGSPLDKARYVPASSGAAPAGDDRTAALEAEVKALRAELDKKKAEKK